jgi:hypothetical protein
LEEVTGGYKNMAQPRIRLCITLRVATLRKIDRRARLEHRSRSNMVEAIIEEDAIARRQSIAEDKDRQASGRAAVLAGDQET